MKLVNQNRGQTKYKKRRIYNEQNGMCNICNCNIKEGEMFILDHIIPMALKGSNKRSNLQVICIPCNWKKTEPELKEIGLLKRKLNLELKNA